MSSLIVPIEKGSKIPSIVISGDYGGSGKTVCAKKLAEIFEIEYVDTGAFFRKEAEKRGFEDLAKFAALAKIDATIDEAIDAHQIDFLKTKDDYVLVARLGAFLQPNAFRVFLSVDPLVGAQRVFADIQKNDPARLLEIASSPEELAEKNKKRFNEDRARYLKYYGVDYVLPKLYNISIDTTDFSPIQVSNIIQSTYRTWLTNVSVKKKSVEIS